jgi:hypothetical protein
MAAGSLGSCVLIQVDDFSAFWGKVVERVEMLDNAQGHSCDFR